MSAAVPLRVGPVWQFADPARLEPLKWLAVVAMVCDHVAVALLPEHQWLRQIGRFALPVFLVAFGIGLSCSRDPASVGRRLLVPAFFAQLSWLLINGAPQGLNVLFLCAFAALALAVFRVLPSRWRWVALAIPVAVAGARVEAGILGFGLIAGGYLASQPWGGYWRGPGVLATVSALWLFLVPTWGFALGLAAVVMVPRLPFVFPRRRGLLAWVYTVHLALLAAFRGLS